MGIGRYTRRITSRFLESVAPPPINAIDRVLLYEFDTARWDLLPQHYDGLQHVLPYLSPASPPASVWVGGLASRRGSESINIPLARRRAAAVEAYLLGTRPSLLSLTGRHSLVVTSFGERQSVYHRENSEFYRSVLVVMSRLVAPPSPPRRRQPDSPTVFNRFRIRSYGVSFDGGEVYAMGSYGFQIDYDIGFAGSPPSDPVYYRLRGYGGFGVGLLPFGVSTANPNGPWNAFTAPTVSTTRGFEGRAAASGYNVQVFRELGSELNLSLMPNSGGVIDIADMQGDSRGLGASYGSIVGPFEIVEGSR